jgi:hypothetical protein
MTNAAPKKPMRSALLAFSALALASLSGCAGSTYTTEYIYHPPAHYEGQKCIQKCEHDRKQCMQNQHIQQQNCEHYNRMVRLEYDRCVASGATNCYQASAQPCPAPAAERCNAEFRHCYQSCGGRITLQEVCASGCY